MAKTKEQRERFAELSMEECQAQGRLIDYLEDEGIYVHDDPPSEFWQLFSEYCDALVKLELHWNGVDQ